MKGPSHATKSNRHVSRRRFVTNLVTATVLGLSSAECLTVADQTTSAAGERKEASSLITPDQIIASRGNHKPPHEIRVADPMYRSYSWGQHPTEDTPAVEGGHSLNAWIVVFRSADEQTTTPDARVNVRRLALWAFTDGVWVKGFDGLPAWMASSNLDTSGDYKEITPGVEADGSYSFEFPVNRSLHFSSKVPGLQIQGARGVIALVEARLLGPGKASWAIGAGADFRDPSGSAKSIRQSGFGRLGLLKPEWRAYPMLSSVMADDEIRKCPPPKL